MTDEAHEARMARLSRRTENRSVVNHNYTRFVRFMRLALPVAAGIMILSVFLGAGVTDDVIAPVDEGSQSSDIKPKQIVRNELLNPKFESVDRKSQPYEITAERAVQGEKNKDLIILDQPVGRMTLVSGGDVRMSSKTGAYRQNTKRFFLEGAVALEHSEGYRLESEEAHIDLEGQYAWSEQHVKGFGPDVEIAGQGLRVNGKTGEIIITGPATLVLHKGFGALQ